MHVSPELAAVRADPAPLLTAYAAAEAAARGWRQQVPAVLEELAAFGAGAPLADCAALLALFTGEDGAALALARSAAASAVAAMRSHPWAQLPHRHFTNGVLHSIALAGAGDASLSLAVIDGTAWRAARDPRTPAAASFQPGEFHARVLAGSAEAQVARIVAVGPERAELASEPLPLAAGRAYSLDGEREALVFESIAGALVSLRLHRRARGSAPAREFDLATGRLLHQAAADQRDSRMEMMMALLRRMERADAAPVLAELAREGAPAARWQALRECLALDSGAGIAALATVAGDAGDPLQAPARRLLDSLAERHPAFARLREDLLCPA